MFKLFGKKEAASPEEKLAECRKKKDWAGLAKTYYSLGTTAMDQGDMNRAVLWLHRADTVYSARDDVYEKVGEKLTDDCSERIGHLEDEHILYNDLPAHVEEKADGLENIKVRIWGLLSLARLVKLGERLSVLPGCEALGQLGWAVDTALKAFQSLPTEEEFNGLKNLSGALYELGDSPAFWGAGSEISSGIGAPFQVFDLNGLMGVHLEADAYLSSHLDMIIALSQNQQLPTPETGIIACALLPDYYVRTSTECLEDIPQIKAELERIWNDYDFICSGPDWDEIAERVSQYKALDLLA